MMTEKELHDEQQEDALLERRWVAFFWTTLLIAVGYGFTVMWEAARAEYATFGGLMLAAFTAYSGINAASKWAMKPTGFTYGSTEPDPEPAPTGKAIEGPPPKPK